MDSYFFDQHNEVVTTGQMSYQAAEQEKGWAYTPESE